MAAKKAATKVAKKEATPKAPKAKKEEKAPKSKVSLVSFECSAVIPTQQYGNIQPKIVVTAPTIEEAREVVMPVMEDLYKTYAETPLNGRDPKFYGKVTVTEKSVQVPASVPTAPAEPAPAPKVETPATESSPVASAPSSSESTPGATGTTGVKPEPVVKAEKAISLAASKEALALIRNQIENSVKIDPSFKPDLFEVCDAKYKELDVF